jgi:putative oxidoreductase
MDSGEARFPVVQSVLDVLAKPYASLISRIVLGGVFVVAGAKKVAEPGGLAASIRSYELALPEWFISFSAHALPYLEIMLGLYLLVGLFTKASGWVASALMGIFLVALVQGILRGLEIDCGCLGSSAGGESNLWLAAARDVGLLTLGLHVALAPLGPFGLDALLRRRRG